MNFEGTVLKVYRDVAGVETVGTGHALTADERATGKYAGGITREQAAEILRSDVRDAEAAIARMVKVTLSQEQFDALVSWTFNLGSGALQNSGLLRELNKGNYDAVPTEMLRWCKRKDPKTGLLVVDAGLLARRKAEGAIWQSGHDHPQTAQLVDEATVSEEAKKAFALNFDLVEEFRDEEEIARSRDTDPEIET